MSRAQITVAIPAYKPQFFEQALESALQQSHSSFEIVICDDCPDETIRNIVERHQRASRVPIRYFRNQRVLGEAGNIAQCIELAQGELIKPLYDDDVLMPDCLEKLAAVLMMRADVTLVSSARSVIDADGAPLPASLAYHFPFEGDTCVDGPGLVSFLADNPYNFIGEPSCVMFRRAQGQSMIEGGIFSLDGQPIRLLGDLALYAKLLRQGRLVMLAQTLSSFRVWEQQRTQHARDNPGGGGEGPANFKRKIHEMGWYKGNRTIDIAPLDRKPSQFLPFDLHNHWRWERKKRWFIVDYLLKKLRLRRRAP